MNQETRNAVLDCTEAWWGTCEVELLDGGRGVRCADNAIRVVVLGDGRWAAYEDEYEATEDVSAAYGDTAEEALRELALMAPEVSDGN